MGYKITKRLLDIGLSWMGLAVLTPFFLLVGIMIKLDSPGPFLFRSFRVGRDNKLFAMYKFRTMIVGAEAKGLSITPLNDPRITKLGSFLRRTKIDELPQLFNVLKGEMSLVGPRPEVPRYVDIFKMDYQEVLRIRPGMTDYAALAFRDESCLLAGSRDPESEYLGRLLPQKIKYYKKYQEEMSFKTDVCLICLTLWRIFT